MIKITFTSVWRSRVHGFAVRRFGFLIGLLLVQLPCVASDSGPRGSDLKDLQPAEEAWRLARGTAAPKSAETDLQEVVRQASELKAKGAYPVQISSRVRSAEMPWLGPAQSGGTLLVQTTPPSEKALAVLQELKRQTDQAIALEQRGAYAEAAVILKQIISKIETTWGPGYSLIAGPLFKLGGQYMALGNYSEAEPLFKRSLALALKNDSPQSQSAVLNGLGLLYEKQGRYAEAETYVKQALAIREKAFAPDSYLIANSLNNLATVYLGQGRFVEAEQLYRQSIVTKEKSYGLMHPSIASILNNLAQLYEVQGRYREAEPLFKRSMAITERSLGPKHPDMVHVLNNLAGLYESQSRYGEAEPLYKSALAISEKALGLDHPETSKILSNLAGLYNEQERYMEAERLLRRALAISEKTLGPDHLHTANPLNNLGVLFSKQGRYGEAERPAKHALFIREKGLKSEHPLTTISLNNLAWIYVFLGRFKEAEPLLQRSNRAQVDWLRHELPRLPLEMRISLLNKQSDAPAITFALLDSYPAAAPLALETRLNRQGLLAEIERRQALLKSSSKQTRQLAEQLAVIGRQLSSVALSLSQREPLLEQRRQLEAKLYQLLPALKINPVSTAQVAAALNSTAPQGLLVEFQKYQPLGKDGKGQSAWGPPRYVALLLRPIGSIRSIPLGDAGLIDAAVAEAVAASADPKRQAEAPERLAAVSQLILKPLQAELSSVRELFVSPDGDLNRLPFAALPMASATSPTLAEGVQLRLLTTGRELVRLQQPPPAGKPTSLISNPDFGPSEGTARVPQDLGTTLRGLGPWQPLPGTIAEAEELTPLLRPKTVISGRQATAVLVLQQKSPRILHIATHGFFLADQPTPTQASPQSGSAQLRGPLAGLNSIDPSLSVEPLQRSGLVFAGANQPTVNPDDDGYLTAAEATAMDLSGTELVTLSACDTALGGVRSGEGVYGLQRALAVAGARSTLLSLWKVDDARTATFLTMYYQRLNAREGRADALRNTQAFFRTNKDSNLRDVRAWGAFQLSGDWRPIQGW